MLSATARAEMTIKTCFSNFACFLCATPADSLKFHCGRKNFVILQLNAHLINFRTKYRLQPNAKANRMTDNILKIFPLIYFLL